jgi:hypothetical protein
MLPLSVQRVGGDDQSAWVDASLGELVEQRGEHRNLVGLRADLDLAEHQPLNVGARAQHMSAGTVGIDGPA